MLVDFAEFVRAGISVKGMRELQDVLANWRTAHAYTASLDESTRSLKLISAMIRLEIENKDGPRLHLLTRLHMSFNRMRGRLEYAELSKHATRR